MLSSTAIPVLSNVLALPIINVLTKFYRLKWQGLQVVHLFIELVMMDPQNVNYLKKSLKYLNRMRMVSRDILSNDD